MALDVSEALAIGGGVTGGTAALIWIFRHAIITIFSTKSQAATIHMGDTMLERLQSEIKRLEDIIVKQNARIDELENRIMALREGELDDMSDIAELHGIIEASCMGKSNCPSNVKLKHIIERMRSRRTSYKEQKDG